MTGPDTKSPPLPILLSALACLLAGAALIVALSARVKASRSVAETLDELLPFDAQFDLSDGEEIEYLGLKLRLIRVGRAGADDDSGDAVELALEMAAIEQRRTLREQGTLAFGPFEITAARVTPQSGPGAQAGRGEARFWIRRHGLLAPQRGMSSLPGRAEVTKRLSRGDSFDYYGLRLRLVRVEENDPLDPNDDSAELSLTGAKSSQLVLRELDTLFFENYELTAERVNPSLSQPDSQGLPGRRGEGTAEITVRLIGPPKKPRPRRPIG